MRGEKKHRQSIAFFGPAMYLVPGRVQRVRAVEGTHGCWGAGPSANTLAPAGPDAYRRNGDESGPATARRKE